MQSENSWKEQGAEPDNIYRIFGHMIGGNKVDIVYEIVHKLKYTHVKLPNIMLTTPNIEEIHREYNYVLKQ